MQDWEEIAQRLFCAPVKLKPLAGEYDLNFLATWDTQSCILKVMRPDCEKSFIDMQIKALRHLKKCDDSLPIPDVHKFRENRFIAIEEQRLVWAQSRLEGGALATIKEKPVALLEELGSYMGRIDTCLEDFDHPDLGRSHKWNLLDGLWIYEHLEAIKDLKRRSLIKSICDQFSSLLPQLKALPIQALHNDFNDYNVLVQAHNPDHFSISGLIDFGDMAKGPAIIDFSIGGAYCLLDTIRPMASFAALIKGYNSKRPLSEEEIALAYPAALMRLAVSVVNSTLEGAKNPNDPYITITQAPAWYFLENAMIDPNLMEARLRLACGYPVTKTAVRVSDFIARENGKFAPVLDCDLASAEVACASVDQANIPQNPFSITSEEAAQIGVASQSDAISIGGYGEPRLIYTAPSFMLGHHIPNGRRTVHIGVDVFVAAGTAVNAPLAAKVLCVENREGHLDYGGMVILSHVTPEHDEFFTLYGHLDPNSIEHLNAGSEISAGECFARLGAQTHNGGWCPHLHFQLALLTDGLSQDWPGVVDPLELSFWSEVFPNPAALMNLSNEQVSYQRINEAQLLKQRKTKFAQNLKLSYKSPLTIVRGWKHFLFDQDGQPFLDAYNNVPHVGHAHPRIRNVAQDQLAKVNSNTRYLHPAQIAFAEKLTQRTPKNLSVCFFVNSGSEANELAIRLARAHSGGKDTIVLDEAYHGNTNGTIDISPYKFNRKNGVGKPDWVEIIACPDDYQGAFLRHDPLAGEKFAALTDAALDSIRRRGGRLACFIAETFPSVGGQIIPPKGYLEAVYRRVRAEGGVCIADEVQTGLGRLGENYFAFEEQGVVPDIIVLGKPLGNGHPIGAVITTPEIAASFDNGIEFFSTFGASTLSCRIGKEVLDIVDQENLSQNAKIIGKRLLKGMELLKEKYDVVGDVRGRGLFLGLELVKDKTSKLPSSALASFVIDRMRSKRVLLGTEGPHENVLKIRPPLTIDAPAADFLLSQLDETLKEGIELGEGFLRPSFK